ncbi:MAG: glycoside hydrolase family 3 N-terminal domain-containing protein [Candidatus Nanopelagicales bacterium]
MRRKPRVLSAVVSTAALLGVLAGCSSSSTGPDNAAAGAAAGSSPTASAEANPATDPATWTNERLAAQLVIAGFEMNELSYARSLATRGIGGITLYGTPPSSLRSQLADLNDETPGGHLLIASDEEGGLVQRLAPILGPLPSAKKLSATKTPKQVEQVAADYGTKMKQLGVNVNLAPVADLAVAGHFIDNEDRSFGKDPSTVINYTSSWITGMEGAGVMPVIKHWPGHGSASDTHAGSGLTPNWTVVKDRDAVPFRAAFEKGIPAVMVGHLLVPGLTEPNTPASLSKNALATVRKEGGPGLLIMTDALSMDAVTGAMNQTTRQAVLRSLIAGSDMASLSGTRAPGTIDAIAQAIDSGRYPRAQAIESAKRVLAAQLRWS